MKMFLLNKLQPLNYTQTGQGSDIESENPDSQIPRPDIQSPVVDLTNSSFDLRLHQPQNHSNPFPREEEADDYKKISSDQKITLPTSNKASRDNSRINSTDDQSDDIVADDQSDDIVADDTVNEVSTDHDEKNHHKSARMLMDSIAQPSSLEEVILRLRLLRDAKIARKKFLYRFNKLHRRKGNRFSQIHSRKL